MNKASHKYTLISVAAILLADTLFFGSTNASTVTSQALIVGYLLAVATTFIIADYGLRFLRIYGVQLGRHHKKVAAIITAITAAVLALISIGQFTPKDVMVIAPLIALGVVYFSYGKLRRTSQPSNT